MLGLLAKIIPLDLASTLSPGIFALAIVFLGSKFHPKLRTFYFLIGSALVGLGLAFLGLHFGKLTSVDIKPNLVSALVDLFFGLLFIILGIKILVQKERKIKLQEKEQKYEMLKLILAGIIISITNFDAVILNFTAAKEVGGTDIQNLIKLILLIVNISFFILPITLPLLVTFIFPKFAERILAKINKFVAKYSKYLMFALFVIFGIIFIYRGLKFFI